MIPHTIFLMMDNPVSRVLNNNALLYALYAGLMAGVFEEVGRFAAFRVLVRKYPEKQTAVSYGLGHGGIECMTVLGLSYIQYYMYGQMINSGAMDKLLESMSDPKAKESFNALIETLKNMSVYDCFFAGWERAAAFLLQIALSILVFQAVKETEKRYLLPAAIFLHMAADIPAALYQKGILSILPTEILFTLCSIAVFLYALRLYLSMEGAKPSAEARGKSHELHKLANQRFRKDKDGE